MPLPRTLTIKYPVDVQRTRATDAAYSRPRHSICERALKMAIRHRNNSLFYRTEYGAYVGDVYMTIISTTILHHENPFDYLVALLRHEAEVAADPGAWLPWTYRATLARIQSSTSMVPAAA